MKRCLSWLRLVHIQVGVRLIQLPSGPAQIFSRSSSNYDTRTQTCRRTSNTTKNKRNFYWAYMTLIRELETETYHLCNIVLACMTLIHGLKPDIYLLIFIKKNTY